MASGTNCDVVNTDGTGSGMMTRQVAASACHDFGFREKLRRSFHWILRIGENCGFFMVLSCKRLKLRCGSGAGAITGNVMAMNAFHDMARRLYDGIMRCAVSGVAAIIGLGIVMNGGGDMGVCHGHGGKLRFMQDEVL